MFNNPISYVIYVIVLKKHLSINNIISMSTSIKPIEVDITTFNGLTIPFLGLEKEYIEFVIESELIHFYMFNNGQEYKLFTTKDILNFINNYSTKDRAGVLKKIFKLFSEMVYII